MKKLLVVLMILCTLFSNAFAESPTTTPMPEATGKTVQKNGNLTVDSSNASDGYIMVRAKKGNKRLKVVISVDGNNLKYDLNNEGEYEVFPLQYGKANYTVTLYQNISGKKYEEKGKVTVSPKGMEDELRCFLYPNQWVNYTTETAAVQEAAELCSDLNTDEERYAAIKQYIKSRFVYDHMKAVVAMDKAGVLPDINSCWDKKMGICQDLSALTCAMLRSQGIPAKLMVGKLGAQQHAWVATVIDGKERWFDPTASITGQRYSAKEYHVERYY